MTALLALTSLFAGWSWADIYVALVTIAVGGLLGAAVFGIAMRFDPARGANQ